MNHNNIVKCVAGAILSTSLFFTTSHAATVYEDLFDQVEATNIPLDPRPDVSDWSIRKFTIRGKPTRANAANGTMNITTEEAKYGGVGTELLDAYDFFNQELTFTWSGVDLNPIGEGNPTYQWAKFGVSAGAGNLWYAFSHFLIAFSGTGQFSVQVQQPNDTGRPQVIYVKDFHVPYFNFDSSELSKVQLVLDDTYFRILFVFGNELDQLSFGGTHGLSRDKWFYDTVGLGTAESRLNSAQRILDNAIEAGDQVAIDSAQATYDTRLDDYNTKKEEAEALKGNTSMLVMAASNDASILRNVEGFTEVGAALAVDTVRIETTNTLDVLRNP